MNAKVSFIYTACVQIILKQIHSNKRGVHFAKLISYDVDLQNSLIYPVSSRFVSFDSVSAVKAIALLNSNRILIPN